MKTILTTFLLLTFSFCVRTLGQQTIAELTSTAKEATTEIEDIYDLDVFMYFNLLSEYDTDLKKAVFKKSPEYQEKLNELKNVKAEMLKTIYYTKLEEAFKDYDIQRNGFEIELGMNWGMGTVEARPLKSIEIPTLGHIVLKALPTKQEAESTMGRGVYAEMLFIPIDETNGLEIENDKKNIDVYFFFTPMGKEKSIIKFYNATGNSYEGWYDIKSEDIKADKVRVVVANKSSGKIYFDKAYSYQPPAPKK